MIEVQNMHSIGLLPVGRLKSTSFNFEYYKLCSYFLDLAKLKLILSPQTNRLSCSVLYTGR